MAKEAFTALNIQFAAHLTQAVAGQPAENHSGCLHSLLEEYEGYASSLRDEFRSGGGAEGEHVVVAATTPRPAQLAAHGERPIPVPLLTPVFSSWSSAPATTPVRSTQKSSSEKNKKAENFFGAHHNQPCLLLLRALFFPTRSPQAPDRSRRRSGADSSEQLTSSDTTQERRLLRARPQREVTRSLWRCLTLRPRCVAPLTACYVLQSINVPRVVIVLSARSHRRHRSSLVGSEIPPALTPRRVAPPPPLSAAVACRCKSRRRRLWR